MFFARKSVACTFSNLLDKQRLIMVQKVELKEELKPGTKSLISI